MGISQAAVQGLSPPSLAFIHNPSTSLFDPEKLFIMPEEALRAEIRNEEQREKCIYFRFIHLSTEPTTTTIYFLF
jgi:hypothetical protein